MKKTCKNCENLWEHCGWCAAIRNPDYTYVIVNQKKDRSGCKHWSKKTEDQK